MSKGWIKLDRDIMDDPSYLSEPFTRVQAYIDLLLLAATAPRTILVRGVEVEIKPGQIAMSEEKLSERWQRSRNTVRKYLSALQKEQKIEQQKTFVTTLITITNNNEKENDEQQFEQQNEQQFEQQIKNIENIKNKKETNLKVSKEKEVKPSFPNNNLSQRKQKFYDSLIPYLDKYPKEMLRDFYEYWSEENRSHTKMRCEQQTTWELSRRLAYWARNDKNFNNNVNSTTTTQRKAKAISLIDRLAATNRTEKES